MSLVSENLRPAPAPAVATDDDIRDVLALVTPEEYQAACDQLARMYGLRYREVAGHPLNIKTIIKGRDITFAQGVSLSSRMFMLLHSLGHYFFICAAKDKKIERYAYIYDLRGVQSALHYYETEGQANGLDAPPEMTDQKRKDRVSFEVGANNFATDLLRHIGFARGETVVRTYEAGDINYIVDVSGYGKNAIVPTDGDYLRKYVCAGLTIDPDDTYDDGVYDAASFRIDGIDWDYIEDIKLEIHFF